jgi:prephenate dehydrogenase
VFTRVSGDIQAVAAADLVVLCTPIHTIIHQLAQMAPLLAAGTLVTDVGSTKRAIMNAAATVLPPDVFFIGGHPMAGSDRAGLRHARADLYRDATWALCIPDGARAVAGPLRALVESLGARPLVLDTDTHDQLVALTSHLPHVLAAALANRVLGGDLDAVWPFLAGGFRDTTRIAAANPALWRDILLTNRDNLTASLDVLLTDLAQWRDAIRAGDAPHLEALLTLAHQRREELNVEKCPVP